MPKIFTSQTQQIGKIGENVAVQFLMKQGHRILDRNYTKKWGEIDIIAERKGRLHFVEVKSISFANIEDLINSYGKVSHVTEDYRPEENMHPWKLKRLSRTIQTYLLSNKIPEYKEWQCDLLIVSLSIKDKRARVRMLENIIL